MGKCIGQRVNVFCILVVLFFLLTSSTIIGAAAPVFQKAGPLECEIHIYPPPPIEPQWMHPTGYNDPENAWENETKAYDGYVATKAGCRVYEFFWKWTPWLELTLSTPITCDKIKFYAWYDDLHCNMIDIELFYNGDWHFLYQGGYADREWVVYSFSTHADVTKARVSFHVQRWVLDPVVADLHEFQFFGYC